jgi:acetylornithine deacetylase/succinyl-diaminopimelate desuccinylase-like protein
VLEHHKDDVAAEFALNEGGRVRVRGGRHVYAAVQCAEKVPYNVIVTARGPGGHAAIPHGRNAIVRLSHALARITDHHEPLQLSDITREFLSSVSAVWPDEDLRDAMADVASGDDARVARGAAILRTAPGIDATLRNGISPTLISGGTRTNVIPTEAEATLNIRALPGESIDDIIRRMQGAVDDPSIEFRVRSKGTPAPASPITSAAYAAIRKAIARMDAELVAVPFLSTGATDSAALRNAGIACYGLLPFPLTEEDESRMHGHDERVSVNALAFGLWLTCAIVEELS